MPLATCGANVARIAPAVRPWIPSPMRIVIDLRSCQDAGVPTAARDAVLAFAHLLVNARQRDDMRILLSDRMPYGIPWLRREFLELSEAGRIDVASGCASGDVVEAATVACELSRVLEASFLRDLEPDCVIVPVCAVNVSARVTDEADAGARHPLMLACHVAEDPAIVAALAVDRLDQMDRAHTLDEAAAPRLTKVAGRRRRLAFISPLLPSKTGVAGYNARLIPALADFYDIDVITDQQVVDLRGMEGRVNVRPVAAFTGDFDTYDRVLYHMGNSPFHADVPRLIRDYPGTVTMHDVFLGDLMNWLDVQHEGRGRLQRALLDGHGYVAAAALAANVPRGELARAYECNTDVLDEANGIIVHSAFAQALVSRRFPHYAIVPVARAALCRLVATDVDRTASRRRLGIGADEFVVSTFGFVNHVKLHRELVVAWSASRMAPSARCRLAIVGEGQGDDYHRALESQIAASPAPTRIVVTGYVDDGTMSDYLAASDVAVQLRSETRGESSGAVLDCMAFGLPLITNGFGALAEIPVSAAMRLPVDFSIAELAGALESLERDVALRSRLADGARRFVATTHDPRDVATRYADAIEHFAADGPRARHACDIAALAAVVCARDVDNDVEGIARVMASNQRRPGTTQLFVDVTPIVDEDLKTGIERVVRAVVQRLVELPPSGFRVEPVRFADGRFVYARQFMSVWLSLSPPEEDGVVEPRNGDVFLGLAWSPHAIPQAQEVLRRYRDLGVRINFVVYDLLPQRHPTWFPPGLAEQHLGWLVAAAAVADRLIGISRDVADDVAAWLHDNGPDRILPLRIAHFPLGADIESSVASQGLPVDAQSILAKMRARTTFLMVGTVEPRKGHRQAIEAFTDLWQDGRDVALVIVGKRGWMTEDVEALIAAHPETGTRLIRIDNASDEFLECLYDAATALLAPSYGEGYGLPIVEAAKRSIPVVARDLPVFREVAGEGAAYFHGNSPKDLAFAIERWLAQAKVGTQPMPDRIRVRNWMESTSLLLDALSGTADCAIWDPFADPARERFAVGAAECVIDFAEARWPREVASISGLSGTEAWGRWSDATLAPSVSVGFCKPLPRQGTLSVTARAFGPNCDRDIRISVGGAVYHVRFGATDSTVDIQFTTDGNQHTVRLTPPAPFSPAQAQLCDDARRLGVGLVRLELRGRGVATAIAADRISAVVKSD